MQPRKTRRRTYPRAEVAASRQWGEWRTTGEAVAQRGKHRQPKWLGWKNRSKSTQPPHTPKKNGPCPRPHPNQQHAPGTPTVRSRTSKTSIARSQKHSQAKTRREALQEVVPLPRHHHHVRAMRGTSRQGTRLTSGGCGIVTDQARVCRHGWTTCHRRRKRALLRPGSGQRWCRNGADYTGPLHQHTRATRRFKASLISKDRHRTSNKVLNSV